MYHLGIDFGTSFTKAAVYSTDTQKYFVVKLGNAGIQRNDGRIPTVAYFSLGKSTPYIGDEAANCKKRPNGKFYYNFKPEMDSLCENDKRYQILQNIVIEFFKHMKRCAEEQFNQTFEDVSITVPASAPKDGVRYQMMKHAANDAGFREVLIIPEPVAAAFYLLGDRVHSAEMEDSLFLIYDFGGGTFDTSIIKLSEQQIHVIDESVGSDNEQKWGGIYIDSLVGMDYIKKCKHARDFVALLKDKAQPYGLRMNASEHLMNEPIKVKEELSTFEVYFNVFNYSLLREDFNCMIQNMVDNTIQSTVSLLDSAFKDKLCENIHSVRKVFLIGGTSQIPLIRSRWELKKKGIKAMFSIEINSKLNIVALGASRYRDLRLSSKQLNERGVQKAQNGEYAKAAAFFNNANDREGVYWLGILYYTGVVGRKRQPAKAYKLFADSHFQDARLMMALMKFNNDGVLKDDEKAKELLYNLPDTKLKIALEKVLAGGRNSDDLNTIYQFDAKTLFVKQ